ncbi:hypothetical protein BDZ94DRAFT_1309319 [Collybia nuda]|uniref:Uncharacterized protein n=1 Tax=Collybia nuda TaxID=64659 RepID=A0A9P6CEB2_9AGAR|nr:hypothetical protein BDZ94DRAFT_1309319 [Collybia nuda]
MGSLEDLEAVLKYHLAALAVTLTGDASLFEQYAHLGVTYNDYFRRIGNLEDLGAAIKYGLMAVNKTPEGHPELPGYYEALGISYSNRYRRTGNVPDDLAAALKYHSAAVNLTPKGNPRLPQWQEAVAISYTDQYRASGAEEDMKTALKYWLEAVEATLKEHPNLASRYHALDNSYGDMYINSGCIDYLEAALKFHLSNMWDIAISYTKNAHYFGKEHTIHACITALNILPSLLWLGTSVGLHHDALLRNDVSSFISMAVTAALEVSNMKLAVEFLEQGLSTTHQQTLQLRLEHTSLKAEFPVQAHERQKQISQIQKYPHFSDFLLPPKFPTLSGAAKNGPVIMLNYNNARSDAVMAIGSYPLDQDLINRFDKTVDNKSDVYRLPDIKDESFFWI